MALQDIVTLNQRNTYFSPALRAPYGEAALKKSNHQVNIVRVDAIIPHPDPETTSLEIVLVGGYQVVARKGDFKVGDLAVYIQPDSVVPETEPFRFIWEPYASEAYNSGVSDKPEVPVKRRRITVKKIRKEWSEGLLLPLTDFEELYTKFGNDIKYTYPVGTDVSEILGVTHYDPDVDTESTKAATSYGPKRKFRYPRTVRGWVKFIYRRFVRRDKDAARDVSFSLPVYDVEAFKNYKSAFIDGEYVVVTEKIHGSNARFVFVEGEMYAGSHKQWKARGGTDVWNKALKQNPWIEEWCRAHEGYALYGEVTPTQKGFDYGSKDVQFFVFDIRTPEGKWVDFETYDGYFLPDGTEYDLNLEVFNNHMVPVLYYGPFDYEAVMALVDGQSEVSGANHVREGIVISTVTERAQRGLGRTQLKVVSNAFLFKDSK